MRVTIDVDEYTGDLNRTEAEAFLRQLVRDEARIAITDIHVDPIDVPDFGRSMDPVVGGYGGFTARVWLDPPSKPVDETEGAGPRTVLSECQRIHPGKTHTQWLAEKKKLVGPR